MGASALSGPKMAVEEAKYLWLYNVVAVTEVTHDRCRGWREADVTETTM